MKDNSKKVWLFIGLFIIVAGVILMNSKFDLRAASTDYLDIDYTEGGSVNDYYNDNSQDADSSTESFLSSIESDSPGLAVVLFVQAFVTIHMSVFVLWPLAKIFGKDKYKQTFMILFIARIIILLILDMTIPVTAMMADFIFIFIGAFLIVPLCSFLTGTKDIYSRTGSSKKVILLSSTNDVERAVFDSDSEVSSLEIANLGFGDIEVLKRALIQHYQEILQLYSERNFSELIKLCSPGIYTTFKTETELYDKLAEKLVISDVLVDEGKIIRAEKHGQQIFLDLKIKYSCIEYVLGSADNLVRGSKTYRKEYTKVLSFSKRLANNIITTCPNCNASIDESDVEFCSYCGTAINFTGSDWVLKKETILKEK